MKYFLLIFLFISSCSGNPVSVKQNTYWDIEGFFRSEVNRFEKSKPIVNKTVSRNGSKETRSIDNINWNTELSLFIESDINKPAWKDSYKVINNKNEVTYKASDSSLRTQRIHLTKDAKGGIKKIWIVNKTSNMLYNSSEELLYITDSIYTITKKQHVVLIGDNQYKISGIF